jgi:PAS domain S-box-containing protein/putative nucleotidyltransferase with HDIG domain
MLLRVHPDDRERTVVQVDAALGGLGVFEDRLRLLLPDGTSRWVDVEATVEFDDAGNPLQYFGTIQDVSEDVEHKLAIEARERLFRATFDQAAVGICHVAPDGHFLRVNEGACRILGYDEAEVLKLSVAQIAAAPDQPDEAESLDAVLRGALRNYTKKTRYRRRDGCLIWARVTVSLLRDQAGEPVHFIYIIEDITREQAAAEREQAVLQKLEKSLHGAISLLARTQEQADPYTAGHQQRVAELAVAIGRRMRLAEADLDDLMLGAKIHDIGKINVPAQLLTKPGAITGAEFELIKTHCEAGYDILRKSEMPLTIADIVRHHHERWDGSGYPDGLKGTEISLLCRIVSVADTVEAVTSHRPYRPARGLDVARTVIREGSGTLFDPQVVDHCLAVLDMGEVPWTQATL